MQLSTGTASHPHLCRAGELKHQIWWRRRLRHRRRRGCFCSPPRRRVRRPTRPAAPSPSARSYAPVLEPARRPEPARASKHCPSTLLQHPLTAPLSAPHILCSQVSCSSCSRSSWPSLMATTGRMPPHTARTVATVPLAGCRGAPGADGARVLPLHAKLPRGRSGQLPEIGRAGYNLSTLFTFTRTLGP